MEHRQSLRLPANAHLHLYSCGKLAHTGRIREVSRDGLFVVTDTTGIKPNQVLEFELTSESQPSVASHRGKAVVVHNNGEGVGLMLAESQHQVGIRELYSWLARRRRNSQCRAARPAPKGDTELPRIKAQQNS